MEENENEYARQRDRCAKIVFQVMLPIVLAKYALYSYLTYTYEDRNFYPDLKFDSKNIHANLYISKNQTVISNEQKAFFTRRTFGGSNNLNKYIGVTLNKSISMDKNMSFEVKTIFKPVFSKVNSMLFEIGFEHLKDLDTSIYLRSTPGTIYIRVETCINNGKYICLMGHDGRHKYDSHRIYVIDESKTFDIRFGFNIKPREDVIEVTLSFNNTKPPNRCFCTFKEVGLHSNMWPVFGMSDPNKFRISMKLVNAMDLKFDTSKIHPMIFISDDYREILNVNENIAGREENPTVIANISFDIKKPYLQKWPHMAHFEVLVEYTIVKPISGYQTLFSIGLGGWPIYDDKHFNIIPSMGTISVKAVAYEKSQNVYLLSERNGLLRWHPGLTVLSSSLIGSYFKGIIKFSIDFFDRAVTVTSDYSTVVFDKVDFTKALLPFFSLDTYVIDAKMTLNEPFERPWYRRLRYWLRYSYQRM